MFDVCVCFVICKFVSGLIFFFGGGEGEVGGGTLWSDDVCDE